jgi:hypothetical protein
LIFSLIQTVKGETLNSLFSFIADNSAKAAVSVRINLSLRSGEGGAAEILDWFMPRLQVHKDWIGLGLKKKTT